MILGCNTVKNLDQDPNFKPLLGKVFVTQKDFAVLKFKDNNKNYLLGITGPRDVHALNEMPK